MQRPSFRPLARLGPVSKVLTPSIISLLNWKLLLWFCLCGLFASLSLRSYPKTNVRETSSINRPIWWHGPFLTGMAALIAFSLSFVTNLSTPLLRHVLRFGIWLRSYRLHHWSAKIGGATPRQVWCHNRSLEPMFSSGAEVIVSLKRYVSPDCSLWLTNQWGPVVPEAVAGLDNSTRESIFHMMSLASADSASSRKAIIICHSVAGMSPCLNSSLTSMLAWTHPQAIWCLLSRETPPALPA